MNPDPILVAGSTGYVGGRLVPQLLESGYRVRVLGRSLEKLQSGGSTAGAAGLKLAYKVATENFIEDGNNRIILVYKRQRPLRRNP